MIEKQANSNEIASSIRLRNNAFPIPTYEQQLRSNKEWGMNDASLFFEGKGKVHETAERLAKKLAELGIPYAIVGGLALFEHGFERFTQDVDILVTKPHLRKIHDALDGLGYLPPFKESKNLRDTITGVKIDILTTGGFPGDGKEQPVSFPDPSTVAESRNGKSYINLPTLVTLKLASGMSGQGRTKDIGDVEELIKALLLPKEFANSVHEYVRPKFMEIWNGLRGEKKRYVMTWRNKFLTLNAKSIKEMSDILRAASDELNAMISDGVQLDSEGGTGDDYAELFTHDPIIAEKYGMHDESELWDDEDDDIDNGAK